MTMTKIRIKRQRKKISALDKYLIYCITFFTLFTIAELITSSICGSAHDTPINAVKWFCGGEVFLCAMIKRHKLNKEPSNVSDPDEGGMYYDD